MPNFKYTFYSVSLGLFLVVFNVQAREADSILWTANWSPDDSYFVVGGSDKILRTFDGTTFQQIKTDTLGDDINRLRWHPTKNLLAAACFGDQSRIINYDTGEIIPLPEVQTGARAVAWNKDGKFLAIADYEGFLHIWTEDGTLIHSTPKEDTKSYTAIDWHPKRDELIVLGEYVRFFDFNGKLLHKFRHRKDPVLLLCVTWHQSGTFFVIGDYGIPNENFPPLLQFWKANRTLQKEALHSKAEYRNMSWNKKGNRLATASDALRIWNKKGKLLYEGQSPDKLWGVDFSKNGKFIVTSSETGLITVWTNKGEQIKILQY